jgi:hypothetical protein
MGVMRLADRAFEVINHPDLDLTWFVKHRIFPMCDPVFMSRPHGVEPRLT